MTNPPPNDPSLYEAAQTLTLDEKVSKALLLLQHYERDALAKNPMLGYRLCDSFGKDSCVILDLARQARVRFAAHHNICTIEPPELIRFGRKHHPDTVLMRPPVTLTRKLTLKSCGPPTRQIRWCCALYKEHFATDDIRITGVRAQESPRRAATWRQWHPFARSDNHGQPKWILNPILYWTEDDVWAYLRGRSIPYPSLYDEGFSRVGCIGCPLHPQARLVEFKRWPRIAEAWRRAVYRYHANFSNSLTRNQEPPWFIRKGLTTPESLWLFWLQSESDPLDNPCQMGLS